MAFPADDLTYDHLDEPTDSPALARSELLAAVQKINQIISDIDPNSIAGALTVLTTDNLATQNLALTNADNGFTALQTISNAGGKLDLNELSGGATTYDVIRFLLLGSPIWKFRVFASGGFTIGTGADAERFTIAPDASDVLRLENGDITYGGVSLIPKAQNEAYGGFVGSGGTGNLLPSGWSASLVSNPGRYRIFHTMGTSAFGVTASINSSSGSTALCTQIANISSTTFDVRITDPSTVNNDYVNEDFNFVVARR